MSTIEVQHLSKLWADTRAVDDVTFTAPQGNFTVLLGPSGCGKSTTLRLIAGLEGATSGRIVIGGREVTDAPPSERDLSMVFQSYALFPHLSVAENIVFGLRVRRVPRSDRTKRLAKTAELLGLSGLLDRRPAQLSGGQQQRVALGRAIIAEKPVCLMDEPLSNLDAKLRHEMRVEIRALQKELGISMIYVTHDQAEAMSMADRVILLRDGRIEQDAPPEDICQNPSTTFVAGFIGTPPMNIIPLEQESSGAVVTGSTGPSVLPTREPGLALGVRPEDIRLADTRGVPASVESIEYLGADSIVDCRVGNQRICVRTHGRTKLDLGTVVHLEWSPHAAHVFDAANGKRRDDLTPREPPDSVSAGVGPD